MELALYGPGGFYMAAGRAGRRGGDFLTSPEVGPLFGAVLARVIDAEWERQDRPGDFTVVELGAGPGTLARSILHAQPQSKPSYVAVERSDEQRASHPAGIDSMATLPSGPWDGVVIANELLDNVPFRLAVNDGGWREAFVTVGRDGRLEEVLGPPLDPLPPILPAIAPHGARAPLQTAAARLVDDVLARLHRGVLLVVDFATPTAAELAERPWREWLRTYRGHGRGGHYLANPGAQDITAEVALDQLATPTEVCTQAELLGRYGIHDLVDSGRQAWRAAASSPTTEALLMRSRVSEAEALLDPAGLGGFTAAQWRREP